MAEGGGLLNRYRVKSSIWGSNPHLSASFPCPLRIVDLNIEKHRGCRTPGIIGGELSILRGYQPLTSKVLATGIRPALIGARGSSEECTLAP